MQLGVPFARVLHELRDAGWRVAVHNDYRLNGEDMTFWLLTHPVSRRFVKGEGKTDMDALMQCRADAFAAFSSTVKVTPETKP